MAQNQKYLGDGLYVQTEGDQVVLWTHGFGDESGNTVYLDPEVLASFLDYVEKLKKKQLGPQDSPDGIFENEEKLARGET